MKIKTILFVNTIISSNNPKLNSFDLISAKLQEHFLKTSWKSITGLRSYRL